VTIDLAGLRVMVPVTRERGELAALVRAAGAHPIPVEFIAIAPPADQSALDVAVAAWCGGAFDWLAVTSRNAVLAMEAVATATRRTLNDAVPPARVAAVGEATRSVCASVGLSVGRTPETATARGLVGAFPEGEGTVVAPVGD
jgi:uroporphyrinogen-III synthase/uroporphyrinogen III methyltransferase/synthase